ncbi:MAG TPA: long-chain fatty acid--CoA ligase [Actinocrinis sp.]|jgi:long-chain acyl-CoA synthetase
MSLSLATVLAEPAWRKPDKVAVVEGADRRTYRELWGEALDCARALRDAGVEPGDRVALLCPNTLDFPRAYYGILAAGAVAVPISMLLTAHEIEYILRDSAARMLIGHVVRAEDAQKAAEAAGTVCRLVGGPTPGWADGPEVNPDSEPLRSYVQRAAEDPAVVIYTSGTTGKPKGAVLSHLNLVMNATVNGFDCLDTRPEDTSLGCLPLFHIFGQTVSMNTVFRVAATVVLQPRFDGNEAIELMLHHGINTFHGVPQMYLGLIQAAKQRAAAGDTALPDLKIAVSGGASLPLTVLEEFERVFGAQIMEGYGLSETSPTATVNQPVFGPRAGTVGHQVWGVEVEIARAEVDDRIELLAPGELGEIVIRGHNVFSGYLGNPEETEKAMVDGWFRSGDLGTKDEAGYVTIMDRKKDMVIRGGFNVYPREVEEELLRHPAIAQAAVIGLPDEEHGEEVCACVILKEGRQATAEEIIVWSQERLARYKYPRVIVFRKEFPLGPSLKVLKRELRTQVAAERAES